MQPALDADDPWARPVAAPAVVAALRRALDDEAQQGTDLRWDSVGALDVVADEAVLEDVPELVAEARLEALARGVLAGALTTRSTRPTVHPVDLRCAPSPATMPPRRSALPTRRGTTVMICADDDRSTTAAREPLSPPTSGRPSSLFEVELQAQADLTASAHHQAVLSGDLEAAEDAAARLADLQDLLLRQAG